MNQRVSIIILNWNGWKVEMVRGDERWVGLTGNGYWIAHYRSHITNHRLRITDHTLPIADRDMRESPVREMVKALKEFGVEAYGYDPLLSKEEIEGFSVKALDNLDVEIKMDGVIVAVAHDEFRKMKLEDVKKFMNDKPIIVDVRGIFDEEAITAGI